jgi:hypothetical protein
MSDVKRILESVPTITKLLCTNIPELKKFKQEYKARETFVNASITGNSPAAKAQREAYLGIPEDSIFIGKVTWHTLLYQTQREQRQLRLGTPQERQDPLALALDMNEDNYTTEWILDRIDKLTSGTTQLDSTSHIKEYHEKIGRLARELKATSLKEAIPAYYGIIKAAQKTLNQTRTQEQLCTDLLRITDPPFLATWAMEQYDLGTKEEANIQLILDKLNNLDILLDDMVDYYDKQLWPFIQKNWDEDRPLLVKLGNISKSQR